MKQCTIYQSKRWRIISYGNGLSYSIYNGLLVAHIQGDAAAEFRDAREAAEDRAPNAPADALLATIWRDLGLDMLAEYVSDARA